MLLLLLLGWLFREGMGGNGNEPEPEEGDDGTEEEELTGEERRVVDGKGVESERREMEGPAAAFSIRKRAAPFLSSDSW